MPFTWGLRPVFTVGSGPNLTKPTFGMGPFSGIFTGQEEMKTDRKQGLTYEHMSCPSAAENALSFYIGVRDIEKGLKNKKKE